MCNVLKRGLMLLLLMMMALYAHVLSRSKGVDGVQMQADRTVT